MNFATANCSS